jgi:hypothetical protein
MLTMTWKVNGNGVMSAVWTEREASRGRKAPGNAPHNHRVKSTRPRRHSA